MKLFLLYVMFFFLAKKGLFDGNFTAANLEISNPFKNCPV